MQQCNNAACSATCNNTTWSMQHATCGATMRRCKLSFRGASYNHPQMHHMDTACYTAFSDKTGDQSTLSTSDLSLT